MNKTYFINRATDIIKGYQLGAYKYNGRRRHSAWTMGLFNICMFWLQDLAEYTHCDNIDYINDTPHLMQLLLNNPAVTYTDCRTNSYKLWYNWATSGKGLCYDEDICNLLCTPHEIAKFKGGKLTRPNRNESWTECYARALYQAFCIMRDIYRNI